MDSRKRNQRENEAAPDAELKAEVEQLRQELAERSATEKRLRLDSANFNAMQASDAAGTYLGLLGMQEGVRLAGGETAIISEAGKGSTIRALFAATRPSAEES